MSEIAKNLPPAPSRRALLHNAVITAAGAALFCATVRRAQAQTKMTQTAAGYQDKPQGSSNCSNCNRFVAPSSCNIVDGAISPNGWCHLYAQKTA